MILILYIICLLQSLIIGSLFLKLKKERKEKGLPKFRKNPDIEEINPILINDVIESSKIEEWDTNVKQKSGYPFLTWEVESTNPQKTLKIKTILRDYAIDGKSNYKVGYFILQNLESGESISFDSSKEVHKDTLLEYVWGIVFKENEKKVEKETLDYKSKIENIKKHLKTLKREEILKKLFE